jgi:hypothetical protein
MLASLALFSTLTLTAPAAQPDILLPGTRPVEHTLVLEGDAAERQLVAAPTRGFGMVRVELGEPFRFSSKYGTRLWLFEPGVVLPERYDRDQFESLGASLALPAEVSAVPLINPLARVQTTMRLAGVAEGKPRLKLVGEERLTDWWGTTREASTVSALLGVAGLGTLALFVLFALRWRRRRSATE